MRRLLLPKRPPMDRVLLAGTILSLIAMMAMALLPGHLQAETLAGVLQQEARAEITSPASFSTVRGNVSVQGTAQHPEFERYELYYTVEPGDNWVFLGEAYFQPVSNGLLATWNTEALPDGTYSLRLRVVRRDGNYEEAYARSLVIANTAPTPTPTEFVAPTLPPAAPAEPTATPTPEATPTPISVEQPEIPTPTPRPTATPTPEPVAPEVDQVDDDGGFFASTFDLSALEGAFATGLTYAGAVFLAVGAFFGLKRVLLWLWYLIAP